MKGGQLWGLRGCGWWREADLRSPEAERTSKNRRLKRNQETQTKERVRDTVQRVQPEEPNVASLVRGEQVFGEGKVQPERVGAVMKQKTDRK